MGNAGRNVAQPRGSREAGYAGLSLAESLFANRRLLASLAYREVREGFVGSVLGPTWVLLSPLVTILIYLFLFAVVLQVKIEPGHRIQGDYAMYILAGLVPWLLTAEVMNRSCSSIIVNASIVKEVIFPIEILPAKSIIVASSSFIVSYGLFFVYSVVTLGAFPPIYTLFLVIVAVYYLLLLGIAMLFAAITPFFRDWAKIVALIPQFMIYITPIVYVSDWVPPILRPLLYLNPFSYTTWVFQDVLFFGEVRHPAAWVVSPVLCIGAYFWGAATFWKLKNQFGNVL